MRISRADRSVLAEWWFTFDRVLLSALLTLIALGVVLSLAGSPAVAIKKGFAPLYFFERHVVFVTVGVVVMLAVSLLSPRGVRRLALGLFVASLAGMVLVLLTGEEINGARRWLRLGSFSLQPSELGKPGLAVLCAWAFAESERRPEMPAFPLALGLYAAFAVPLVLQPDVGQTVLVTLVWAALLVLSGHSYKWLAGLGGLGIVALGATYAVFPHVRSRVDRYLAPVSGDNSQLDHAFQSFVEGGFLGRGPGEGTIKLTLPDAHTDFIFAVIAEEYGALMCLAILILFALATLRPLARGIVVRDPFTRHGLTALALLFGLQALINMGVNVGLLPAKGMTLPFISAGGSSTLAVSITCGMLMALSRRRPDAAIRSPRLNSPGLAANAAATGSIEGSRIA